MVLVQASAPDITFKCSHMPEVCTNMCWAMRCASPTFPQTLTWDDTDMTYAFDERVTAAGCKIADNKCQERPDEPGYLGGMFVMCSIYPFVTTRESAQSNGHAVSRCVRVSRNVLKESMLRRLYRRWKEQGYRSHRLAVGIANPGAKGVNYCLNEPCINDGFQVQDGMIKVDRVDKTYGRRSEPPPSFRFFKTAAGVVVASMEKQEMGANFTRTAYDEEDEEGDGVLRGLDSWVEEVDGGQVRLVSDVMLEEVTALQAAQAAQY
ncbi:hypothetical protein UVI_02025580 [Ustilaginoidea virens]|nr:hypothetical protein UVI_02025580 [Ustilaginoidea virens]